MQILKQLQFRGWSILLTFSFLVSALFINVASAGSVNKTSFRYRTDLGAKSPALDVYFASDTQNAPVIIFIHGGGWVTGKKSAAHNMPRHFTELGFVFVSLDYRLVPDVRIEDQLDDIDHALAWISQNISKFGGDSGNLHLMGHSAGAHLATMTALVPGPRVERMIANGALHSVISNDTRAYDVPRIAAQARGGKLPRLYANAFGTDPARWRNLSPFYQISVRPTPAFLLLYSGQGRANGRSEFARDFANRLGAAGAEVTLFDGSKYSHRGINVGVGKARDITGAIDNFLANQTGN